MIVLKFQIVVSFFLNSTLLLRKVSPGQLSLCKISITSCFSSKFKAYPDKNFSKSIA